MQKEWKTALRRELWLHFIIAFNLFFPISFDAVNFIIDGVFQSYFTPRLKNESFMVLHFSPNEQTTWKIPKRGKSYEAKGWDIIISLDLCSPLSLAHSFFSFALLLLVLLTWDYAVLHNAAKIRQFTCAFCLKPFLWGTRICAFNEFQMNIARDSLTHTQNTEKNGKKRRKKIVRNQPEKLIVI